MSAATTARKTDCGVWISLGTATWRFGSRRRSAGWRSSLLRTVPTGFRHRDYSLWREATFSRTNPIPIGPWIRAIHWMVRSGSRSDRNAPRASLDRRASPSCSARVRPPCRCDAGTRSTRHRDLICPPQQSFRHSGPMFANSMAQNDAAGRACSLCRRIWASTTVASCPLPPRGGVLRSCSQSAAASTFCNNLQRTAWRPFDDSHACFTPFLGMVFKSNGICLAVIGSRLELCCRRTVPYSAHHCHVFFTLATEQAMRPPASEPRAGHAQAHQSGRSPVPS